MRASLRILPLTLALVACDAAPEVESSPSDATASTGDASAPATGPTVTRAADAPRMGPSVALQSPTAPPSTGPAPSPEATGVPPSGEPLAPPSAPGSATGSASRTPAVLVPGAFAGIEDERNSMSVFQAAAPATVFVTQKKAVVDRWSRQALEVPAGTGSGFVWDPEGHVVTNFHVVDGATSLEVTMYDGTVYPARFVGGDRSKDLAVLELEAPEGKTFTAVRLPPKGQALSVGQKTLAIGNPFGLDHTLTTGVISALGREVVGFGRVTIRDMIQTDASINPGNSGGPLLNSAGELIGINTMIYSGSGQSAGIGFAVPVSTVRRVVPQILRHGAPLRAGLGVSVVSDEIAKKNGIKGVVIESVDPRSPAAAVGLRGLTRTRRGTLLGDILVGIDETPILDYDDLYSALDAHAPGDEVTVRIRRESTVREVRLQLTTVRGN